MRLEVFIHNLQICAIALGNNVDGHVIGEVVKRVNNAENQGLIVCSACCYGNDCNQEGCFDLKKKSKFIFELRKFLMLAIGKE